MILLAMLLAIQVWVQNGLATIGYGPLKSAEVTQTSVVASIVDDYDVNLDAFYELIEGQDLQYAKWIATQTAENTSSLTTMQADLEARLTGLYSDLARPMQFPYVNASPILSKTAYTLVETPAIYFSKPEPLFAPTVYPAFNLRAVQGSQ